MDFIEMIDKISIGDKIYRSGWINRNVFTVKDPENFKVVSAEGAEICLNSGDYLANDWVINGEESAFKKWHKGTGKILTKPYSIAWNAAIDAVVSLICGDLDEVDNIAIIVEEISALKEPLE